MPAKGWIEVSDQYCKGCELCISACPPQVMELDMSRLTPRGYHPAHIFKDGCKCAAKGADGRADRVNDHCFGHVDSGRTP